MINVALCFDSGLQDLWSHVVNSVRKNTEEDVQFYFICDQTVSYEKVNEYRSQGIVVAHDADIPEITEFFKAHVKTKAQFLRWLIPDLFGLERCIYLDNDVLVIGDVKELWDVDLDGHAVGLVPDPFHKTLKATQRFQGNIPKAWSDEKAYLSGLMVIDCSKWRQLGYTIELVNFVKRYQTADMIAMGWLLSADIMPIDPMWSVPLNYVNQNMIGKGPVIKGTDYTEGKLLHCHGRRKFWEPLHRWNYLYKGYA